MDEELSTAISDHRKVSEGPRLPERIEVVAYDTGWPGLFSSLKCKACVQHAMATSLLSVDHIGVHLKSPWIWPLSQSSTSRSEVDASIRVDTRSLSPPEDGWDFGIHCTELKTRHLTTEGTSGKLPASRRTHIHVRRVSQLPGQSSSQLLFREYTEDPPRGTQHQLRRCT